VAAYQPERGDFIYVDCDPQAGREQSGNRPALVLSPQKFNIATGFIFACPITSQGKGSPFDVPIPRGAKITGFILADHLKSMDWVARNAQFHSKATQDTIDEVLGRIEAILDL
jgi:mRNA interferase MazF